MRDRVVLREGALVSHRGVNWRILHVPDFERVLAARIGDGRPEFLYITDLLPPLDSEGGGLVASDSAQADETTDVNAASEDSFSARIKKRQVRKLPSQSELSEDQKKAREAAVLEFQDLMAILNTPRRERRKLLSALCKRFGYNLGSAYRRLKIVELHGTADALLPAVRSDSGEHRLSEEVRRTINEHLKQYRFVQEPKTLPDILELINGKCRSEGWEEISLATLRRFEQKTTLKEKLEAQGKKKKAADAFRPKAGHLPYNDYPFFFIS